jgi:putative acetyltransferase
VRLTALRRLHEEEMDHAAVIHRKAFDARLPWLAGLHTPAEDRAFFRDRVFVECDAWGAFDGELIGFIAFRERWIDQLYVAPDRQRQGVGATLLQIAKAASSSLLLWTFQRNAGARRFYEKHGFAAVEETDGSRNEECEPDVRYCWSAISAARSVARRHSKGMNLGFREIPR